jgi:hypothetical protein
VVDADLQPGNRLHLREVVSSKRHPENTKNPPARPRCAPASLDTIL